MINRIRNIIIDTDPGHDDAMAIFLALAHEDKLKILGITTVSGNQSIEKINKNLKTILEVAQRTDIEISQGASKPMAREAVHAGEFHGKTGMDGPKEIKSKMKFSKKNAVEFMYEKIINSSEKVSLVPIGPLTNIALLIKRYPTIKSKIELISFMGGSIGGGNWTAAAEFNIFQDPEAADIVFNSGIKLVMSGLTVSNQARINHTEIAELNNGGQVSKFVFKLMEFYKTLNIKLGEKGSPIHDACAVAYLINPYLFEGELMPIQVETKSKLCDGQTIADRRKYKKNEKNHNVFVLLKCKREEFKKLLYDAFKKLD